MVYGFAVLKGLLIVPVGTMGFFWPGVNPYKTVNELMGCFQGRELRGTRAPRLPRFILLGSFSGTYGLWLLIVPVGTMGSFWPGVSPCKAVGEFMGCVQGRGLSWWKASVALAVYGFAVLSYGFFSTWVWPFQGRGGAYGLCPRSKALRAGAPRLPRLPGFVLLVAFSGACGLWFCCPEGAISGSCGNYEFFLAWGLSCWGASVALNLWFRFCRHRRGRGEREFFLACGLACRLCPRTRARRARFAFRGLSCWEASVTLYLWFRF